MKTLYIAYGSNLNLRQMAKRCPTAKPIGTSVLKNYELLFRGTELGAVATVEPSAGSKVPILAWELQEQDEHALDHYEGYPSFYDKQTMEIVLNGSPITAMIYIMNDGHFCGKPSPHYFDTILEGYETAGFDPQTLFDAVDRSLEIAENENQQNNLQMR